jgi:dTDP-4-amino-4,6-dideoxygalactose transaminase
MKVPFVDLVAQWAPLKETILKDWDDILSNSAFVGGSYLQKFESELADFCGVRFGIGVSSGTAALTSILRGLGVGPGDKVGVQAETFIASAYAVTQVGAEVVLVDPDGATEEVMSALKAFIVVHIYGEVDRTRCMKLVRTANRARCYLIEDACQAIGCEGVGEYGVAAAFSFYPAKNLGCAGQGGAVITNDQALSIKIREYINQGWVGNGLHAAEGGNERLDSIQAAILSHGLRELPKWNTRRQKVAKMYDEGLPNEIAPFVTPGSNCVYHLYPILLLSVEDRDSLSAYLKDHDVANARHYPIALTQQDGFRTPGFPNLESKLSRHLTLPMFPTMTDEQVQYVIDCVNKWWEETDSKE